MKEGSTKPARNLAYYSLLAYYTTDLVAKSPKIKGLRIQDRSTNINARPVT